MRAARAARLLSVLFEHEMAERETRRLARHRAEPDLPPDKSIDSFDFDAVPSVSKPHVAALIEGDGWLEQGANVLFFGPPGVGKSHLVAAIGHGLIDRGWRVLFELISQRYERKSIAITANQPFSAWDQVFPEAAMTVAAVDRLIHHSTIFELNVESYRRKAAEGKAAGKAKVSPRK